MKKSELLELAVSWCLEKPNRQHAAAAKQYGLSVGEVAKAVKRRRASLRPKIVKPKGIGVRAADWLYRNSGRLVEHAAEELKVSERTIYKELNIRVSAACEWLSAMSQNGIDRAAIRFKVSESRIRAAWEKDYEAEYGPRYSTALDRRMYAGVSRKLGARWRE